MPTSSPADSTGSPILVAYDQLADVPWKNGLGRTRELLCLPDADHWNIRLSMATIEQASPFSKYPGVVRHFAVLEGDGVLLDIRQATHRLTPESSAIAFQGEDDVTCRPLGGTTLDLNLMVQNQGGHLRKINSSTLWRPETQVQHVGILSTDHAVELTYPKSALPQPLILPRYNLAWFDRPPQQLLVRGSAWQVTIFRSSR